MIYKIYAYKFYLFLQIYPKKRNYFKYTALGKKWHKSIEFRDKGTNVKITRAKNEIIEIGDTRASRVTGRIYRKTFVFRLLLYAWTILCRFIAHSDTFLLDPLVRRNGRGGKRARSERGKGGAVNKKIASLAKKDEEKSSEEDGDRRSPLDRHSANFSRIPNVR